MPGFTRPFSPNGTASAVPPLPWRFAADQVMIHFRADADALNAFIRAPLMANPDRQGEAFIWTPNLQCEPLDDEVRANIGNPARTHYNVCALAIPSLFRNRPALTGAFQWVDKDWLVILSWLIGTCAKQAEFQDSGLHPLFANVGSSQTGGLGTTFTRTVSRNGEQLIRMSYVPQDRIEAQDLAFFQGTFPLLTERHIPDLEIPPRGRPLVHDLTQMTLDSASADGFTRGPATLQFNASADNEELGPIQPTEVLGGYRWRVSWIMPGIKVVHDYLADGPE